MESKKLGFLILGVSIVLGFMLFSFMGTLNRQEQALQCAPTERCQQVRSAIGTSHIAIGIVSFIASLGFFLLFFNKSEQAILERLEQEKNTKVQEDKFSLVLNVMDTYEQRILKAVKEQDGITQTTLTFRTDLSKAKVSQVLTDFEKRNLIRRIPKGKTYSVHLAQGF